VSCKRLDDGAYRAPAGQTAHEGAAQACWQPPAARGSARDQVPPRTFQSWENAEVETDRENYKRVAAYYSRKLGEKITANWILFGQDTEPPLPNAGTPDLFVARNGTVSRDPQLDRIESMLGTVLDNQATMFGAVAEFERQLQAIEKDALEQEERMAALRRELLDAIAAASPRARGGRQTNG
jgi:hypothetical protein